MRQLLIPLFTASLVWTSHLVHAQIAVGCFGNQPDSSVGADAKSYQDIYMSQGACTNFCKGIGTSYALTLDGSTCRCSSQAPLGSNKVDDSKCDKPCMGYPFEMCGGTSSSGLANVLLIGGSTSAPSTTTGSSGSSGGNNISGNNNSNNSGTNSQVVSGGKALNANNPGTLPPPEPSSPLSVHGGREKKEYGRNSTTGSAPVEGSHNGNEQKRAKTTLKIEPSQKGVGRAP